MMQLLTITILFAVFIILIAVALCFFAVSGHETAPAPSPVVSKTDRVSLTFSPATIKDVRHDVQIGNGCVADLVTTTRSTSAVYLHQRCPGDVQ
jgi:hypothetical protein